MYNNHAYNVAGLVIEKLSGLDWGDFISKELFTPLGMTRSYTYHPDDENLAVPYNILDDRTPSRLPFCNASSKTKMFAGQSVRTSMSDYLRYCQAYLESLEALAPRVQAKTGAPGSMIICVSKKLAVLMGYHESSQNVIDDVPPVNEVAPASEKRPLREIGTIVRPRVSRPVDSLLEQTYALGWNRTQLPGSLDFGWNSQFLSPFPLLGSDYPGKLAIWHGGNMPGTTSAVCLLPESGTVVVVFQNSLGLCDVADWACQMIIDTIFLGKPAQDYLSLAKKSLKAGISRMEVVEEELRRERITGTSPGPLLIYPGRFVNRIGNWFIDIKLLDGQLHLEFLGKTSERFALRHYHYHTFVWNLSYNETVKIGQYIRSYEYYRIEFELNKEGEVDQLRWKHDTTVPEGEVFVKQARGTQRSA